MSVFLVPGVAEAAEDASATATSELSGRRTAPVNVEPRLETSVIYSDNLFATANRKVSDEILAVRPGLSATFSTDALRLGLQAEANLGRHARNPSEDYDDWKVVLDGRARLAAPLSLVGGAELAAQHEGRSSPNEEGGQTPTNYDRAYGFAGLLLDHGGLRARLAGTATRLDFADVGAVSGWINNDDRDRLQTEIGLRVAHTLSRGLEAFGQGSIDERIYDQVVDDAGLRRSSRGFSAAAGLRLANAGFSGEVFAGALEQDYVDPRLKDVATFDIGVTADWRLGDGLSGSFRLDRSVEDTTLTGASSYVLTNGSLSVRSAVHPRLAVGAGLSGARYDYQGISRSDVVAGANLWGRFWVSSRHFVGLDYTFSQRASDAAGADFDESRAMVTLGAQLRPRYTGAAVPFPQLSDHVAPAGAYAALFASHGAVTAALDGPRGQGWNTADFGDLGSGYAAALGYGVLADKVYLGVEASVLGAGPRWVHIADRTFSTDRRAGFDLSGRLGYALGDGALLYLRAGASWRDFRTAYAHADEVSEVSSRRAGMGVGLGAEAGDDRFFVRAEYSVSAYPDDDIPAGGGDVDNVTHAETQFLLGAGVRFGARGPSNGTSAEFGGLYAGFSVGHGALATFNSGPRSGDSTVAIDRSSDGPTIGVLLGWGASAGRLHLGVELDAAWSQIQWNIERDPNGRTYSLSNDQSTGLAARLGWQVAPASLLYLRGGPVRTRFAVDYATANASVAKDVEAEGVRIGVGLETALSPRMGLRLDYDATSYEAFTVAYGRLAEGFDSRESRFRVTMIRSLWR